MVSETRWSAWSIGMLCTQVLVALPAVVVLAGAVWLITSGPGEIDWGSLGAGIALFFGGIAAIFLLLCTALLALTVQGRRRAARGSYEALRHTAAATTVAGGGWLALCLSLLSEASGTDFAWMMAAPGIVLLVPAVGCWRALPTEQPA